MDHSKSSREAAVVFQVRDDESFCLGRDIGDVEVGKVPQSLRTLYIDVGSGGKEKVGIKNNFKVLNLNDSADRVPPT